MQLGFRPRNPKETKSLLLETGIQVFFGCMVNVIHLAARTTFFYLPSFCERGEVLHLLQMLTQVIHYLVQK